MKFHSFLAGALFGGGLCCAAGATGEVSNDPGMKADGSPAPSLKVAALPKSFQAVIATKATFHMDKFPIGFWNYVELETYPDKIDETEVRGWADCGASVMISPETQAWVADHPAKIKQILQWCQKYDIKLIVADRRSKVGFDAATQLPPANYKEKIKNVYDSYSSYPAFFGLTVHDEPVGALIPATVASVRAHREVAPQYHPFMNWWAMWPEWNMHGNFATPTDWLVDYVGKSKSDFILYDNYTQCWPGPHGKHPKYGDTGWDKHFLNLIHYRLASLHCGIPFWVTLACVSHMNYEVDLTTLRWQFNTSLAAGAGGVMWFFYYARDFEANYRGAPIDERWERTSTWYDLRRVHLDFQQKYGDLFNRLVSTRLTFVGRTYAGGLPFTPNGVIAAIKPNPDETAEPINIQVGEFADLKGDRYVMLVNLDRQKSVCLQVTFPGKDTRVHTFNQGQPRPVQGNNDAQGVTVNVWLAPAQEAVFGVDSIQARATAIKLETAPSDRCVSCLAQKTK